MKRCIVVLAILSMLAAPASAAFRGGNGPLVTAGAKRLWLYDPGGSRLHALKTPGRSPDLAPDSEWIVFVQGGDIAKVRVDGTRFKWLTNDSAEQAAPTWSRGGHRVLYLEDSALYRMRANGTNAKQLVDRSDLVDAAWSPDGAKIAYVSCITRWTSCDVYVMNSDGSEARAVNSTGDLIELTVDWAPDAARLVSQCGSGSGMWTVPGDICVTDITGAMTSVVYEGSLRARGPVWSPNGRKVAFAARPPGEKDLEVFTIRPDGTQLVRVTYNEHNDAEPDWGPR
ncbi:MAG TPA: hypothetical protein VG929_03710 [Actinomycetota bacterium]|nr:hypothetical protein [Actinomycetota bacterium]